MADENSPGNKRQYHDLLTLALPDTAIALANALIKSESGGPYDHDSEGKELKRPRQKALRYLELAVGNPCFLDWVGEETERAEKKADEIRLKALVDEANDAEIRAEERQEEIERLRGKS